MKLKVDLWLDYSYFVCGMGQYTLFPIDFNGKPEIFLKHFEKKKNFKRHVCVWLDFDYFSGYPVALHSLPHVNFVFF